MRLIKFEAFPDLILFVANREAVGFYDILKLGKLSQPWPRFFMCKKGTEKPILRNFQGSQFEAEQRTHNILAETRKEIR